jgi:hypothetical protein
MIAAPAFASVLRRIEAELRAVADNADEQNPACPYDLRCIALKIGNQAEMVERELIEA